MFLLRRCDDLAFADCSCRGKPLGWHVSTHGLSREDDLKPKWGIPQMPTEYTGQDHKITAQVGEEFIIALESNPTTGYEWEAGYDSSILQLIDRQLSPSGPGIGSGGIERFRFRCLAVGDTRLRLTYKRRWEKISAEDIVFQVHAKN